MLLAASPGGVSANLFSHLFGGNVAMNISLTAINTLLSIVSLPLIANFAIDTFAKSGQVVPMQTGKVIEVIGIVLVPVAIGMIVKAARPGFAARMDKPMKRFSMVVLAVLALIAIAKEWTALTDLVRLDRPGRDPVQRHQPGPGLLRAAHAWAWTSRTRSPSATRSASTIRRWRSLWRCRCWATSS